MFWRKKSKPRSGQEPSKEPQNQAPNQTVKASLRSLESRLMFDAAAAATAAEVKTEQVAQEQADAAVTGDGGAAEDTQDSTGSQELLQAFNTFLPIESRTEVVFVDPTVPNYRELLSGMDPHIEVIMLDGGQDGLEQIANVLAGRTGIDAIHLISHGSAGELQLGTGTLTTESMSGEYADELAIIQKTLSEQADILVYGCDFAEGETGQAAVTQLAALTGADVQASSDVTGNVALGGDWALEVQTGSIETQVAITDDAQARWMDILSLTASGSETRANTTTSGTQTHNSELTAYTPDSVAMDASGNYVSVWESAGDIHGQLFNSAGTAQGSEFIVASNIANERLASVAMNSSGAFVVTWERDQGTGDYDIYARLYNASGTAVGSEFLVNETTSYDQEQAKVAMDINGNFAVVWESNHDSGGTYYDNIYAQRYDATGAKVGSNFMVNTTTSGDQDMADIAMDSSGNFVIVWEGERTAGSSVYSIYGQRYDSSGAAQGAEFLVNSVASSNDQHASVAMNDSGNFVVTWDRQSGGDSDIQAQRFNSSGVAQGSAVSVTNTTSYWQELSNVAMDGGGNFVVSWSSNAEDGSGWGVYTREYDNTGTALTTESRVATTTSNGQDYSGIAYQNGKVVVTWSGNGTGDTAGIFMQRYTVTGGNAAPTITSNSGGVTASVSVAENTTAVTTVTATDASVGQTLAYSISGGTDAAKFTINSSTGALSFITAPNYEAPADSGGNNVYDVIVTVTDGNGGADSQTLAVTVTAVNEAPSFTSLNATPTYTEGGSAVVLDNNVTITDTELTAANNFNGATLTVSRNGGANSQDVFSGSGTLSFSGGNVVVGGTTIGTYTNSAGTLAMTFNSSATNTLVNSAMQQVAYSNSSDAPPSSVQINWTFSDENSGSQGSGGVLSATGSVTVSITAVNDAPVLVPQGLTYSTAEGAAPITSAVSVLIGSSVTDVDSGALSGVAIFGVTGSGGTLEYSLDGTTWSSVGALSSSNALLLRPTDQVRFTPDTDNGGTIQVSYRAWDQTSGSAGSRVDVSVTGGTTAFSSASDVVTCSIASVNDAPVLADTALSITVAEDAGAPSGAVGSPVSAFTGGVTDVDSGASKGIAITGSNETNGTWYYTTNSGSTWTAVGAVSNTSALLLADNGSTRVYFSPSANFNGTSSGALTVRAWDQTTGTAGSKVSTASNGGTTAFSSATDVVDVTVTAVNDAPMDLSLSANTVVENAANGTVIGTVTGTDADTGDTKAYTFTDSAGGRFAINSSTGQITVANSSLLNYESATSHNVTVRVTDSGGLTYDETFTINVTNVNEGPTGADATITINEDTSHTLTTADFGFSDVDAGDSLSAVRIDTVPGAGTLTLSGVAVTNGQVIVVSDITAENLVFTPAADGNGGGYASVTFSVRDSANAYDAVSNTLTFDVTPVNDAPIRTSGAVSNLTVSEDAGLASLGFAGVTYSSGGSTDESGQTLTYAVTAIPSHSIGDVFLADGTTRVIVGSYTLAEIQGMQFKPATNATGVTAFQFNVYDSGGTANGGADTISEFILITVTAVNDTPTITNLSGDSLSYDEGDGAVVIEQAGNALVADVDSTNFDTGTLTLSFTAGSDSTEDVLGIRNQGTGAGQIGVSGSTITYGATTIGTFAGGSGGTNLVITLNGNATPTAVTALIKNITYENTDMSAPTTGARTVRYVLTDGDGGTSANYDTTVTVNGVNDAPVNTVPGAQTVNEDTALSLSGISVTDVDGNLSTVQLGVLNGTVSVTVQGGATISAGSNGSGTLTLNGSQADINATLATLVYQGTPNYTGADTLTVTSTDASSVSDVDTVAITVTGQNDAPTDLVLSSNAVAENAATGTVVGTISTTDPDAGDSHTYSLTDTAGGRFTINSSTGEITVADGSLLNYESATSHTVTVRTTDAGGLTRDQTFTITVANVNEAPVAVEDRAGLRFDGVDDFVEMGSGTVYEVTDTVTMEAWINREPSSQASQIIINKEGEYEVGLDADGSLKWAFANTNPGWAWHDTGVVIPEHTWTHIAVTYDHGTITSYVDGVVVEVFAGSGSIGDAHPTKDTLRIGGRENNPANQYFLGQISEVQVWNVARTAGEIGSDQSGTLLGTETGLLGYWKFNENSGSTADNLAGNPDGILGGGSASQTPQWATYRVGEDTTLTVAGPGVLVNDYDVDGDAITAVMVTGPSHASAFTLNPDGSFSYTPAADFSGTDSFTYRVSDGASLSNIATVHIQVDPVNDAPRDLSLSANTVAENAANGSVVGTVTGTDPDAGDTQTYSLTDTAGGRFAIDSSTGVITVADGSLLNYESAATHTVTVRVADSAGLTYDETFTIALTNVNEAPTGADATITLLEDTPYALTPADFGFSDVDAGDGLSAVRLDSLPAAGTLTLSGGPVTAGQVITAADLAAGQLVFTPAADANGSGYATFTFTVQDSGTLYAPTSNTLTFNVTAVNDVPTDLSLSANTVAENAANGTVVGTVTGTDADAGDTKAYTFTDSAGGRFAINSSTGVITVADGSLLNYESAASHTVTVRVTDSGGLTYDETFTIALTDVNETPTALTLSANTVAENAATGTAVGTISTTDPDAGDSHTYSLTDTAGGRFTINSSTGEITVADGSLLNYESATSHTVTVRTTDAGGLTRDQTFTITLTDVNEAPTGADATITILEDTPYALTPADFGFSDVDAGDGLSAVRLDSLPAAGTLTLSGGPVTAGQVITAADLAAGQLVFTPAADANGPGYATFTFTVQDGGMLYAPTSNTLTFNVTAVNDAPIVLANTGSTVTEGGTDTISSGELSVTDVDHSAAQLTFSIGTGPAHGRLELTTAPGVSVTTFTQADIAANRLVYVHDGSETTSDSISFTVSDGAGGSLGATTMMLTVTPVNDAPTITSDGGGATAAVNVAEHVSAVTIVGGADVDLPAQALSYSISGGVDQALFTIDVATGALRFVAPPDFEVPTDANGDNVYLVQVRVTDTQGASVTQTLQVTVTDVPEDRVPAALPPSLVPTTPPASIPSPPPVSIPVLPTTAGPVSESSAGPLPTTLLPSRGLVSPAAQGSTHRDVFRPDDLRRVSDSVAREDIQGRASDQTPASSPVTLSIAETRLDGSEERLSQAELSERLFAKLDEVIERLEEAVASETEDQVHVTRIAAASGVTLSVGFVVWALRSSALLASLFATVPAWQLLDPLPVVATHRRERRLRKRAQEKMARDEQVEYRGLRDLWDEKGEQARRSPEA